MTAHRKKSKIWNLIWEQKFQVQLLSEETKMIEGMLAFAIVSCIRVSSDVISKPSGSNE